MDRSVVTSTVRTLWDADIVPSLSQLVAVPAISPAIAPAWEEHGELAAAIEHVRAWIASRGLPGVELEVVQLAGRTPLLVVDVPAFGNAGDDTVFVPGRTAEGDLSLVELLIGPASQIVSEPVELFGGELEDAALVDRLGDLTAQLAPRKPTAEPFDGPEGLV